MFTGDSFNGCLSRRLLGAGKNSSVVNEKEKSRRPLSRPTLFVITIHFLPRRTNWRDNELPRTSKHRRSTLISRFPLVTDTFRTRFTFTLLFYFFFISGLPVDGETISPFHYFSIIFSVSGVQISGQIHEFHATRVTRIKWNSFIPSIHRDPINAFQNVEARASGRNLLSPRLSYKCLCVPFWDSYRDLPPVSSRFKRFKWPPLSEISDPCRVKKRVIEGLFSSTISPQKPRVFQSKDHPLSSVLSFSYSGIPDD